MQRWRRPAAGAAVGFLIIASPVIAKSEAVKPETPNSELAEAVAKQKPGKVDKLLKPGVAIDAPYLEGRTALFYAASQGDKALVGRLLDLGAQVDARDASGATPLMVALRNPATQWTTAKLLLDKGADINAVDKGGRTPLMEAVLRAPAMMDTDGQVKMVEALLAAGADPARTDATGAAAMHHAAAVGEPRKVLELLLAKSADPHLVTSSGANVLMMAAQNRQRANVDYLLGQGFRPVRIKAVGERTALAQDVTMRANALAEDWAAQFLVRKGLAVEARAAYAAAVGDYEAAAKEAERLVPLYEQEVAKDKQLRDKQRTATGLMTIVSVGAAIAAGGGVYYIYSPVVTGKLEQDEYALATLRTEAAETVARAASIRKLLTN